MTIKQKLHEILESYVELEYDDVMKAMRKAYDLGKKSKIGKQEDLNPYHIDYKRQTKLF